MQQPAGNHGASETPKPEHNQTIDDESRRNRRSRVYVELCGTSEDINGFLDLCADQQVKMIVHRRPPLPQCQ